LFDLPGAGWEALQSAKNNEHIRIILESDDDSSDNASTSSSEASDDDDNADSNSASGDNDVEEVEEEEREPPAGGNIAAAWVCSSCTYRHEDGEASFLCCAICGTEHPPEARDG